MYNNQNTTTKKKQEFIVAVTFSLNMINYRSQLSQCTLSGMEGTEELLSNMRHNEPTYLSELLHDAAVQNDEPWAYGLSAAHFDRFGNQGFEWGRYGNIHCRLELSRAKINTFNEYVVIGPPTSDTSSIVAIKSKGADFDPEKSLEAFLNVLGLTQGDAYIDSITVIRATDAPMSSHSRALKQFSFNGVTWGPLDIVIANIAVKVAGATEIVKEFITKENICAEGGGGTAEECCREDAGGVKHCSGTHCMTDCFLKVVEVPVLVETSDPETDVTAPLDLGDANRRLTARLSPELQQFFAENPTQYGLTNALNNPNFGDLGYPPKESYFVPTLLMGTTTEITSPSGYVPFHNSYIWFRQSFTRRGSGIFKVMTTCDRLDESKIGMFYIYILYFNYLTQLLPLS